jgi:hypothetical protein
MHDTYQVLQAQSLLIQAPVALVLLAGLIVAGYHWKRHPTVSLLVTVAFCFMLVGNLGIRLLPVWLGGQEVRGIEDAQRVQRTILIVGVIINLTSDVGLCLLLWAAFGWRSPRSTCPRDDEGESA